MQYPLLYLALTGISIAHTIFQEFYVNGVSAGHDKAIRLPKTNGPIADITSNDMICNIVKEPLPKDIIPVAAGDKVITEWHHEDPKRDEKDPDDPIAPSHKGPHTVHMAKIDKATNPTVTGLSWFKIQEDGLVDGKWATERLAINKGKVEFQIPPCLAPGDYLLRAEIIALHEANRDNGAQPYMECVQLTVSGTGSVSPQGVAIPGMYKATDPGIKVDIYNGIKEYVIPGSPLFTCDGTKGSVTTGQNITQTPAKTDTDKTKPASTTDKKVMMAELDKISDELDDLKKQLNARSHARAIRL